MNPIITLAAGQSLNITGPIALSIESIAPPAPGGETLGPNLVLNGGFAQGAAPGQLPLIWVAALSGGGELPANPDAGVTDTPAGDSGWAFCVGAGAAGVPVRLSQVIPTVAGRTYRITYKRQGDGITPNLFESWLGAAQLESYANVPGDATNEGWLGFSQDVVAGANAVLAFDLSCGDTESSNYLYMADVSVREVL